MAMHRVHAVIRGRVQGVGFRYFALRRAMALGLQGWVRNCADGSVELEAEGERAALEDLLEVLRQGPPGARVTEVRPSWDEGEPLYRTFQVMRGL